MAEENRDMVQGTLEMLVLKTLALEPMHGYGVALRIEQISDGVSSVNPGSLLPALSRMERAGRIKAEWSDRKQRRANYALTERGESSPTGAQAMGPPNRRDQPHSRSLRGLS